MNTGPGYGFNHKFNPGHPSHTTTFQNMPNSGLYQYAPAPVTIQYQHAHSFGAYQSAPAPRRNQPIFNSVPYQPAPAPMQCLHTPASGPYQPAPAPRMNQSAPTSGVCQPAPVLVPGSCQPASASGIHQAFNSGIPQVSSKNSTNSLPPQHGSQSNELSNLLSINKQLKRELDDAVIQGNQIIKEKNEHIHYLEAVEIQNLVNENSKIKSKLRNRDRSIDNIVSQLRSKEEEMKSLQNAHDNARKSWEQNNQKLCKQIQESEDKYTKRESEWKTCYEKDTKKALSQIEEKDDRIQSLMNELGEAHEYINILEDSKEFVKDIEYEAQHGTDTNDRTKVNKEKSESSVTSSVAAKPQSSEPLFKTIKTEPEDYQEDGEPNTKKYRCNDNC